MQVCFAVLICFLFVIQILCCGRRWKFKLIRISMSEQVYKGKQCAFHQKEIIVNFCKNPECLLPMCPSCIKIHSEEHRTEKTYGEFQSISKVVSDMSGFLDSVTKELSNHSLEIKDHRVQKAKEQQQLSKRIKEAKEKMMTLVERFFSDFEKEVAKSITCFNESMEENYSKVGEQITHLQFEVDQRQEHLRGEKVLKTLIGFLAKEEQQKYLQSVDFIKNRLDYLEEQKVDVVCSPPAAQKVIEELGNYIHLAFQNWENEIKYVADFVKTGQLVSTGDGFFKKST